MAEHATMEFDPTAIEAEENYALAPVSNQQIVSFADTLFTDVTEQGYWASFPVETMDDKKKLHRARHDNKLLNEYMGEVIAIEDIVLDTMTISDPVVGAKKVPCVHLIAADGEVYQSSSSGCVNTACDIISDFGMPDTWDAPIEVVCKEVTTKKGMRYKYLSVL